MYEKYTAELMEQAKRMSGPAEQVRDLALDTMEKALHLQLDAARTYVDMGLGRVREAAGIHDVEGWRVFAGRLPEVTDEFGKRVAEDGRTLLALGEDYGKAVQHIAQTAVRPPAKPRKAAA